MTTFKRELISFLEKLPPTEPVFILRAQDRFAADLVRIWADLVEAANAAGHPDGRGATDKTREARLWAAEMDGWPKKKTPD